MWFGIAEAGNVIMVLSDRKITPSGSHFMRWSSEGFYVWLIQWAVCHRESFRNLVHSFEGEKHHSDVKMDAILSGCMSTIISANNHQEISILRTCWKASAIGLGAASSNHIGPLRTLRGALTRRLCLRSRLEAKYKGTISQQASAQMKDVPSGICEWQGEGKDHFWKAPFICSVDWG